MDCGAQKSKRKQAASGSAGRIAHGSFFRYSQQMHKRTRKNPAKILFGALAILYPLLVFCALVVFNLPVRYLSIGIIVFAIAYSVINSRNAKGRRGAILFISPAILCAIGAVSLCMGDSPLVLKLYPALADLAYLTIFTSSFLVPPPLADYFIEIFDRGIKDRIPRPQFERYCFRATLVWCVFFVLDGAIALLTVFFGSDIIWAIYNSGITYVIMGFIFFGEFIVLKMIEKQRRPETDGAAEQANADT
jgi:uncharacterized membrane protein